MRSPLGTFLNKTPVPYANRAGGRGGLGGMLHRNDREAQLRAMGSVGTLFAIANRTAKATAGVEWKLYRKAASGKAEDRTEVTSHAALDLWNRPNPFFGQDVFVETGAQHKILTGEMWWVIARHERANLPLEMWPVRPDRMEPVPDPEKYLLGYMYSSPTGEQIALRLEDVIFIRTPNPMDPYRGMGAVQAILTDLDATRYSAEWNRNFFRNSAEPGGIIEVPDRLGDDEFAELRDRWNEQHKGVANAHRVAILEHGKWIDRKFTQRDMQFAELRSVSSEVIREALGFPKAMLGSTEDVNRANAEAGEVMFARWLIVPDVKAMRSALNTQLLPMYGATARGLEFDYVNPVPEDVTSEARVLASKAEAARALRAAQYNADDVLSAVGLPEMGSVSPEQELLADIIRGAPTLAPVVLPLLGFELPTVSEWQGTPLDLATLVETLAAGIGTVITREEAREILAAAGAPIDPAAAGPAPAPAPEPAPGRPEAAPATPEAVLAAAVARLGLAAPRNADEGEDADLEAVRVALEDATEQLLAAWEDEVLPGWYEAIEDQVRAAVDDGDVDALTGISLESGAAAGLIRTALGTMAEDAAGQVVAEAARQGVTVTAPEVDEELRNAVPRFSAAFGQELVDIATATASLLASGLAASAAREAVRLLTPDADGEGVAARVGRFMRGLTNRFRRDQLGGALHRAQNTGRLAAMEEAERAAPSVTYVASERNDSNRCQPCADIDGTVFADLVAARGAYGGGGYHACEGGIRCRGTVVARWDGAQ